MKFALSPVLASTAAAMLTLSASEAQFIVYDDFSDQTVTEGLWTSVAGSPFPTVAGGTATFDGSDAIRSNGAFPIGTTLRFTLSSVSGGAAIVGTTSQNNFGSFASDDALYTRDDGGTFLYVDAVVSSPGAVLPTPGNMDFVFGASTLEILDDGVSVYSVARPGGFDEDQRFEIIVYGNGGSPSVVVDQVSYTPEPASIALLSLGGFALLARRRRA